MYFDWLFIAVKLKKISGNKLKTSKGKVKRKKNKELAVVSQFWPVPENRTSLTGWFWLVQELNG